MSMPSASESFAIPGTFPSRPEYPSLPFAQTTAQHNHPASYDTTPSRTASRETNAFSSTLPSSLAPLRPTIARRPRSDPRDNRIRRPIQSLGSPVRRPWRRIHRPSTTDGLERALATTQPTLPHHASSPAAAAAGAAEATPATSAFPTQSRAPRTPDQVHEDVQRRIQKPLSPMTSTRPGRIYIIRDPLRPHLLKVGSTTNFAQRIQHLERQCRLANLECLHLSEEFDGHTKAEHLIHGDLWHLCRTYWCEGCETEHREWYEVDADVAKSTVDRWVAFLRQRPYESSGSLKAIWKYVFSNRRVLGSAVDHEERWDYWTAALLPPSLLEHCRYQFHCIWSHSIWGFLWRFSWQVSALSSWVVTFSLSRDFWSFSILCTFLGCWVVSMSDPRQMGSFRGKRT